MKYTLIAAIGSAIYWFVIKPIVSYYYTSYKNYKKLKIENCDSEVYRIPEGNYWLARPLEIKELPSLPIEKFKSFYYINSKSWVLKKGIAYKYENGRAISGLFFTPYSNYLAYEKFRKEIVEENNRLKKQEKENKTNELQKELLTIALESVQKDIDNIREEAYRQYEEAVDSTLEVAQRLSLKGDK